MRHRSLRAVIFALVAVAVLVIPLTPSRAAEPFEINVIVSLTGSFAFIGSAEAASVRTLESIVNKEGGINGQPVKMVIQDDQSTPATAVQLASGIIAKKPSVLLGPTYLASCLAVAPLVTANNGPVSETMTLISNGSAARLGAACSGMASAATAASAKMTRRSERLLMEGPPSAVPFAIV